MLMGNQTLWATFIGINAYRQNELNGCICDVLNIDLLLREQCAQQPDALDYKPYYLLAPNDIGTLQIEDYKTAQGITEFPYEVPTFNNVSQKAFAHLKSSNDGDVCVFFYSGHGSQMDAPEVFWHAKPDRQVETIVCVDSRDPAHPDARDLIDKELGFLLWDALNGKAVHCLVIMDCCHSGNNTRAPVDTSAPSAVRYRYETASRNKVPLEKYIGYDRNGSFYKIQNGRASIEIARYVHLAAARDSEKAQETIEGGLFTTKLMELLRSGGMAKSYRDLVQSLSVSVRNRAEQNPVAFAKEDGDLDQPFFGNGIIPYIPSYEVRYDVVQGQWMLHGGALHGIAPLVDDEHTIVRLAGSDKEIRLVQVHAISSVLDETEMQDFEKEKYYKATIVRLAAPRLKIGLSNALRDNVTKQKALQLAYKASPHLYFEINFENKVPNSDYLIQLTTDDQYVLTKTGSNVPLFKREGDAASFVEKLDVVGKWVHTSELKNPHSAFTKKDFIFTFEKIEGVLIPDYKPDGILGEKRIIEPDDEVLLSYKNGHAPGFRLSIAISPASSVQSCFVGVLYMESKFGITHELIRYDANELKNNKDSAVHLGVDSDKTIALELDEKYSLYGINEVTDFLKFFVSKEPFNLERYKQDNLELDDMPMAGIRGLRTTKRTGNPSERDWTVFTNRIRIAGPHKAMPLKPGVTDFSSFKVEVPEGFEAIAFAATGEDQTAKLAAAGTRGIGGSETAAIRPPASLWGEALTAEAPFTKGLTLGSDNGVQVLELTAAREGTTLQLPEGKVLVIKPNESPATTRSLDTAPEETIVPYGYDPDLQLYIPIGYTDEKGAIYIQQLPPTTPGTLQDKGAQTRSLQGSIKLFFKKMFKPKEVTKLVLYQIEADGVWSFVADNPEKIKDHLSGKTDLHMLLLLHGIMGDSRYMTEALKEEAQLSEKIQYVLTYEYETLATPVLKAAENLEDIFVKAGFDNNTNTKMTVIAHSTGGLVARWLVEKGKGHHYIKHLILVGTPNAGTELSKLTSSIFGLLTHALNVTGPIKYVITGLSFLLKKLQLDPTRIVKDIEPGSELLQELATSNPPEGVRYSIIGGDTALLKDYEGDDFFFKKLAAVFARSVVHPGLTHLFGGKANDMAVTVSSMQAISGFEVSANMHTVASNHLAYFKEQKCLDQITALL